MYMHRFTQLVRFDSLRHRMSPFRPGLNRVAQTILYQSRRLGHSPAQYDHHGPPDSASDLPRHGDLEIERRVLPEELMRNVVKLTCKSTAEGGVCDVYVVGTSHISEDSFKEVKAIVNFLKPQVVFLELCESRVATLSAKELKIPTRAEIIDMLWKKRHPFLILFRWVLAQVGAMLKVLPGSQFRIAYEEASKYGGKVTLGDRPIQITFQRMWGTMPLRPKIKLIFGLLSIGSFQSSAGKLNKMHQMTMTLVMQEISKQAETMTHERDRYMSCTLLNVAKEHSSVVAVVGERHLQGIKNNWGQPVSLKELLEVPKKKLGMSTVEIISGVAVVGGAIIGCR